MNSKKIRISAVLAAFLLINSFSFASEKHNVNDNNSKQKANIVNNKKKQATRSKSFDNLKWKALAGILGSCTLGEGIYIYNQYKDNKKSKDDLQLLKKEMENMKSEYMRSCAFSLLDKKYKFRFQLSHGRQGSTALFYDKDNRYVVVKTLFKSGDNKCIEEIKNEREAVEFFKDKPKNEHMVFPLECFEDNHFLFVIFPFVSYAEDNSGFKASYTLNDFNKIFNDPNIKPNYETWDNVTKKKCLWHLTKQWFEIYKYFYQNGFYHGDMSDSNILIQINKKLQKNMKLNYDDFIIKLIDWGIWKKLNGNQEFEITDFKKHYKEDLKLILGQFYDVFEFKKTSHKDNSGNNCNSQICCERAFFAELDELIGETKNEFICSSIYKTVGHERAKSFDELIDFCQKQIDKLN